MPPGFVWGPGQWICLMLLDRLSQQSLELKCSRSNNTLGSFFKVLLQIHYLWKEIMLIRSACMPLIKIRMAELNYREGSDSRVIK